MEDLIDFGSNGVDPHKEDLMAVVPKESNPNNLIDISDEASSLEDESPVKDPHTDLEPG